MPDIRCVLDRKLKESQAKTIIKEYVKQTGVAFWDAKQFFQLEMTNAQLELLERRGKLCRVGIYHGARNNYPLYAPDDIAGLGDDELSIPQLANTLNQTALLERGWTKTLIDKYLPSPELQPIPHYPGSRNKMYVWRGVDVAEAECRPEYKADFEAAQKRRFSAKASAEKTVETKRKNTMAFIQTQIGLISVRVIDGEALIKRVLRDKQAWYDENSFVRCKKPNDAYDADYATLERWTVNYIRHELTDYDETLYELSGRVGCHDAYKVYRNAVLKAIGEAYPLYVSECCRQMLQ